LNFVIMDISDQFPFNLRSLSCDNLTRLVGPLPQFAVTRVNEVVMNFQPTSKSNAHWVWNFLSSLKLLDGCVSDLMKTLPANKLPQYLGQKYILKENREAFYKEDEKRREKYIFENCQFIVNILIENLEAFYTTYIAPNDVINITWSSLDKFTAAMSGLSRANQAFTQSSDEVSPGYLDDNTVTRNVLDTCRLLLLCVPTRTRDITSALSEFEGYEACREQAMWRASMVLNSVIPVKFPFKYDDGSSGVFAAGTVVLFEHLSDNLQNIVRASARAMGADVSVSVGLDEGRASSVHDEVAGWRGRSSKQSKRQVAAANKSKVAASSGASGKASGGSAQQLVGASTSAGKAAGRRVNKPSGNKGKGKGDRESVRPAPAVASGFSSANVVDFREAFHSAPLAAAPAAVGASFPPAPGLPIVDFRDAWNTGTGATPAKKTPVVVDFRNAQW
jgi:hypothetical protein